MGTHELDLAQFRHLVAEARALKEQDRPDDVVHRLERALSLWRGTALGDVAPAADTSTKTFQQALRDERIAAVDLLVDSLAQLGRHEDVLTIAAAELEDDPWNERLHEHRLRALAATGRRSEASDGYRRLRLAVSSTTWGFHRASRSPTSTPGSSTAARSRRSPPGGVSCLASCPRRRGPSSAVRRCSARC